MKDSEGPYDIKDAVELVGTFRNTSNALTDPTTVTVFIQKPDGTRISETTPTVTHVSPGVYSYILTVDQAGIWRWRFEGTGTVQAADERTFEVKESVFY